MTTPANEPPQFSTIQLARRGRLLTITLNRPEAMNAVNLALHDDLLDAMWFAQGDPHSDVIVLTGAGRAFSAGGDVDHLALSAAEPWRFDHEARIAKRIVLVIIFNNRARQLRALFDAEPCGERTRRNIAHHNFNRHNLDLPDELLAHVEPLDVVRGDANVAEQREEVLADPVVENTLAVDRALLLGVERGGIVLEVLDDRAGFGTLIEDLGLAFVDLAATGHGHFLDCRGNRPGNSKPRRNEEPQKGCNATGPGQQAHTARGREMQESAATPVPAFAAIVNWVSEPVAGASPAQRGGHRNHVNNEALRRGIFSRGSGSSRSADRG